MYFGSILTQRISPPRQIVGGKIDE